jgi:Na+/H+-dicarboxylate symporter
MNPTKGLDTSLFSDIIASGDSSSDTESLGILQLVVNTVTVNDFSLLLSRSNMLQLIVFSILFAIGTLMAGEEGKVIANFVKAGSAVMMKIINIIMMMAPIGLGCYFANVIGELGSQLISGYVRVTVLYLILTVVIYFGLFSLYAFLAGGIDAVKAFWSNALPPTVTSLATCSSAASIPVNLDSTKKMGVPDDIAETVIPLGANIHKDGSVVTGVLKIAFLLGLLGTDMNNIGMILAILGVAFINGAVMGAIPGGGFISEMLIVSAFGINPSLLPIIVVIGTILDAPATLLNSTENTLCAMLVARLVEGKDWLNKKVS